MATKGEDLNLRMTATDEASAVIDRVADKVGDVEDREHEAKVTADGAQAEGEIDKLLRALDGLSDEDKAIVLRARADSAKREVAQLERQLANADKYDGKEIRLRVEARDNAKATLDRIDSELRSLDGRTVRPKVAVDTSQLDALTTQLDQLGGGAATIGSGLTRAFQSPAALVGLMAGGLLLAGNRTADLALEAAQLAALTGNTVEEASKLNAVWKSSGADLGDLMDILANIAGVLQQTPELATKLGVDTKAPLIDQFLKIVDALGTQYPNAADRAVAANQLFGEQGSRQVTALITRFGDLEAAITRASGLDQGDVDAARNQQEQVAKLTNEWNRFSQSMGSVVVPAVGTTLEAFNEMFNTAEAAGQKVRGWFDADAKRNHQIVEGFNTAEAAAASFDLKMLGNVKTFDEARAKADEYTEGLGLSGNAASHFANLVALAWNVAAEAPTPAISALGELQTKLEGANEAAGRLATVALARQANPELARLDRQAREAASGVDTVASAADRADAALAALGGSFGALRGRLGEESSLLGIAEQVEAVRRAAEEAYASTAANEVDAAAKRRDHRQALIGLTEQVADYLATLDHVPLMVRSQILATLDQGELDKALAQLAAITAPEFKKIFVEVLDLSSYDAARVTVRPGEAPSGAEFTPSSSAPPPGYVVNDYSTTTVISPSATPELVTSQERLWARLNGPRVIG